MNIFNVLLSSLFFCISYVWEKFQELYGVALGASGLEMLLRVTQTRTVLV